MKRKIHASSYGFSHITIFLIFAVLGVISLAGWRVYDLKSQKNNGEDVAVKHHSPHPETTDGFTEYRNEELGFKFAYPKEWGAVNTNFLDNGPFTEDPFKSFGKSYDFNFSNEERGVFSASVKTSRFSPGPKGPIPTSYLLSTGWRKEGDRYYVNGMGYGSLREITKGVLGIVKFSEEALYTQEEDNQVGFGEFYAYTFNLPDQNMGALSLQAGSVSQSGKVDQQDITLLREIAKTVYFTE